MQKNVASQKVALFFLDTATNLGKTGDAANLTGYVSKDHGTVTALTDTSATEMDATNAKGWYLFDVSQAETNADELLFTGKSSTSGVACVGRPITPTAPNFSLQSIDSNGRVDVVKIAGTAQTARDIGASVLLSNGTGTGQVKIASGYLAMTWADIAAPTTTVNFSGTTIKTATDVEADTADIQSRLPAALVSGRIDASVGAMAANVMTAAAADPGLTTELQSGLAMATDLATVAGYLDTEIAAIKAVTDALPNAGALTTIQADLDDIQTRLPAALVSGRIDASVGAMASGVLTATAIAADAITDAKVASDVTIASVTGAVGSVTGAVGSVTGNVGGNVTGSVGSVASGGITRASLAADTGLQSVRSNTAQAGASTSITLDASASATTDFYINHLALLTGGTGVGQARYITAYNGTTKVATVAAWATNPDSSSTFALLAGDAIPGATAPSAATIADAVWDELLSGHAVSGSTGEALSAAGSAGDPWITALPGAYGAGSAGQIVGDYLNASVSSRATQTSVDTIDGIVDAILVDTAEIGAAGAGLTALASASNLATVAGYLDTEIAAILADTNELQTDWANGGRLDLILDARASQTSVDDLPTNAELATALASADDAVLTAVADLPTNAELATALGTSDDATLAAIAALSIPTVGDIADAVHDEVVEGTTTLRQSIRLANAALGGKASGLETTAVAYRDLADTKDRITATVDADGNRSAVTRDLT